MGDWLQRLHTLIEQQDTGPNSVFEQLDPCDNSDEMRRKPLSSHNVTIVTGIVGRFPLHSMPRGCPAGGAQNATRASSGSGPANTRTMTL